MWIEHGRVVLKALGTDFGIIPSVGDLLGVCVYVAGKGIFETCIDKIQ
jgi:hypothetical protein